MKNGEAFFKEAAMLVSLFSLCLFATDKPSDSKAQEASEVVQSSASFNLAFSDIEVEDFLFIWSRRDVLIVDMRSEAEYNSGHISGAIDRTEFARLSPISDSAEIKNIVLYGCAQSDAEEIGRLYSTKNISVLRYLGGFQEWSRFKLPTK